MAYVKTSIFVLLLSGFSQSAGREWVPQLGTVDHPKLPDLSQSARVGDVFRLGGKYYRSRSNINLVENPAVLENLPEYSNDNWRRLQRGSYILPKVLGSDTWCDVGDMFFDPEDEVYYRARSSGDALTDWQADLRDRSLCDWEQIDQNADWMSLLRPEIGDKRLGDIFLPGSHDAGTAGITEDSVLVDRNFLFQLGTQVAPDFIANWSITQPDKLDVQLAAGFRLFDMRIADTFEYDGQFRWWHGLSADEISEGLDQINQFTLDHPEEIVILEFGHFAAPGNAVDPTVPITPERKDNISDTLLGKLGDRMAFRSDFTQNPTMNELLATGRNIINVMGDSYIRDKDDRFWESVVHSAWSGRSNPEDVYEERSAKLRDFKENYPDRMTSLSGSVTPEEKIIIAALINVYGDNETIQEIIEGIAPGLLEVNPSNMSFEGLWVDLVNMAHYGVNTDGMNARPLDLYTTGASAQYRGINNQARHWIARPDLYKPNTITIDDLPSSQLTGLAIQANLGNIVREVTVAHQGNPLQGYYEWAGLGYSTTGGSDGVNCTAVDIRYTVQEAGFVWDGGIFYQEGTLDIEEGFYPPDTVVELEAMSQGSSWQPLWSGNIQSMISTNYDVYIRGYDVEDGTGFAYVSTNYNDFGEDCTMLPADASNVVAFVQW